MSGTKEGAAKARATILERQGEDFFKRIGAMGGSKTKYELKAPKGFMNVELARRAGILGGRKSRRGKKQEA